MKLISLRVRVPEFTHHQETRMAAGHKHECGGVIARIFSGWRGRRPKSCGLCFCANDWPESTLMAAPDGTGITVLCCCGKGQFDVHASFREKFASAVVAGHYLALETYELLEPINGEGGWQPSGIQIYDVLSGGRMAMARTQIYAVRYALSSGGLLAVVESDTLRLYDSGRQNL